MGTPEFAVETLKALVENNYNVVGVITMPDKPARRGHKLQYSPVKQYAMEKNLPLLQPVNLKDPLLSLSKDQVVNLLKILLEPAKPIAPQLGFLNCSIISLPQSGVLNSTSSCTKHKFSYFAFSAQILYTLQIP